MAARLGKTVTFSLLLLHLAWTDCRPTSDQGHNECEIIPEGVVTKTNALLQHSRRLSSGKQGRGNVVQDGEESGAPQQMNGAPENYSEDASNYSMESPLGSLHVEGGVNASSHGASGANDGTMGSLLQEANALSEKDKSSRVETTEFVHGGSRAGPKAALRFSAFRGREDPLEVEVLNPPKGGEDHPEHAPPFYVTMGFGFGAAALIMGVMLFILYILEHLVHYQQHLHAQMVKEAKTAERAGSKDSAVVKRLEIEAQEKASHGTLSEKEVAEYIHGDQERLAMLLAVAEAKNPKAIVEDLVKRGAEANKVSLSKECQEQVAQGLISLAKAAHAIHTRKDHNVEARQKMIRCFKEVHRMIQVCNAFSFAGHNHLLASLKPGAHAWAEEHPEHHGRYDEGAKGASHKNSNIKAQSAIGAYFASEKWIDHAGIAWLAVYSQLCGLVYAVYLRYRFPKMYDFMGPWVLLSRGEAMSLIVTTVMMVLLLTRSFMTWLRRYTHWSTVLQNVVDKHALMHQWCGIMLPIFAFLHVLGHLRGSIPAIINEKDVNKINEVFTYGTKLKFNFNTWGEAALCWPAVTGYLLILILAAFWALSNQYVRRRCFELFHYPHLILIPVWTIGLALHGAKQWLGCGVPLGLLAVAPVVVFYFWSRSMDILSGIDPNIKVKHATIKAKSVLLEIDTAGSNFKYDTGMYCQVKFPDISNYEWHPFTIASAGGSPVVRILFAVAGDWTTQLRDLLKKAQMEGGDYPTVCLRGGYGAPAEGMKEAKHIVMVGAGVGITPFLSFLASICEAEEHHKKWAGDHFETAVLYWVSREPEDFALVNHYSNVISASPDLRERVSVRLVLSKSLDTSVTKNCSAADVALFWIGAQVALSHGIAPTLEEELGAPTQFGRPDWKKELDEHGRDCLEKFPNEAEDEPLHIGVYVCGNPMLVDSLEKACDELQTDEVQFTLYPEQF